MRLLTADEKRLYLAASGHEAPWCVVQRWPWWYGTFDGLTLGALILVKDTQNKPVLCHEMVHVHQWYRQPFTFFLRYLWQLFRVGYQENRYEIEARKMNVKIRSII